MTEDVVRRAGPREWIGLALLVLPMLALSTDLTVLFLALPTVSADLEPTASQALWIVHVYGFLIAGFLVTMGRLGDRIGPRRLLLIGSAAFALLSVLAAFSTTASMLIAARAMLGVAGATLMPSLFSLLRVMFHDDVQRRSAIAIMFSSFSAGGAVGPLLGGALLEHFWWGVVFLINIPPMVLLLVGGRRLLPERTGRGSGGLDLTSAILSVTGMLAMVYGLQELAAGDQGGGPLWMNALAVGVGILVLAVFVRRQRRLRDPLFDLALLANPRVSVSLVTILLSGVGVVGVFYLLTQHLQWVVGLSPLRAGLWTVPYILLNIAGSLLAARLTRWIRPVVVVAIGLTLAAAGLLVLMVVVDPGRSLSVVVAAFSIVGFGQGAAAALVSDLIIAGVPDEKTGSAAAAQEVGGELGTALGAATGGAVATAVYRGSLGEMMPGGVPDPVGDRALESVHDGIAAARALGPAGPELLDAVHVAVTDALQAYAAVAASLVGLTALLVTGVLVLRGRGHTPSGGR
ncbi:MFS transporter [Aeromicrobium sp. PE09-221]|uniref:MFS transporter n=1 Tax=Aeromicrobium sp. PE09-221 TaxID=1898043 RepID=UPI000B3E4EE2|nr:MFS transporter [Aeromicrobium sp. PE09-221]OUZ12190.1 MFS transporter [Aeromicrobium sp. PE09-221]